MKRQIFSLGLIAVTAMSAHAQDTMLPMRLSNVVIEDISGTPDVDDDDPLSLERPQQTEPLSPAIETSQPILSESAGNAPTSLRRDITSNQLLRLRKPLAKIHLNGLATPPPVSQASFTNSKPRWITSGEVGRLDSLRTVTTYCRRHLYFEDATLERCGYSDCVTSVGTLTNVHAGAKFLLDTTLLPLRMIKERPDELVGSVAE